MNGTFESPLPAKHDPDQVRRSAWISVLSASTGLRGCDSTLRWCDGFPCLRRAAGRVHHWTRSDRRRGERSFDSFFRSDHFLHMGAGDEPGPTDSWITLAAVTTATERIRLGTLVSSATFRHPRCWRSRSRRSTTSPAAASGARHRDGVVRGRARAYGPSPRSASAPSRSSSDRPGPVGVARRAGLLLRGRALPPAGRPGPAQTRAGAVPIIVGGSGRSRTPQLAARFAGGSAASAPTRRRWRAFDQVRSACGRSAATQARRPRWR